MGKIKQGILGGFKGKVGTVIGSSWNGIAYMRGLAQSVKNPNTSGQQTQRGFFKEVMELAAQFSNEQLAFLFPTTPGGMTRRNMLVKQLTAFATVNGGEKHVDLANINSLGNAATAELPNVTMAVNGYSLNITYEIPNGDPYAAAHASEYPAFLVVNVTKKKIFLVNSTDPLGAPGERTITYGVTSYGDNTDTYSGFMLGTGSTTEPTGFSFPAVSRPVKTKKHD